MLDVQEQARLMFLQAERILIVTHVRPDGDAIGSLLGLGLSLELTGKQVVMVVSDGLPEALRFLPYSEKIQVSAHGSFDLIVAVDSAEPKRIVPFGDGNYNLDLNIDHHITNTLFARVNLVQSDAASTAEMLAELLKNWKFPISQAVADALMTGILTDTIGFRTGSVNPKTLRIAADLCEMGARLPQLYHQALLQRSFTAIKYWGAGLSTLQRDDGIVWTTLTLADRFTVEYPGNDDADLINLLGGIKDVKIAVIFVEQPDGLVKVSWRALMDVDVSKVAMQFGGGGHRAAAGAELQGALFEIQSKVLASTKQLLV